MANDNKKSNELAKKLAAAKTPEEKDAILAEALKELTKAEGNLDTAQSFIEDQSTKLAELEEQRKGDANYQPEVIIDKKKVYIVHGVDGLTKDELAKDLNKVKALIKNESGAVRVSTE